jgi:hypothetical protein
MMTGFRKLWLAAGVALLPTLAFAASPTPAQCKAEYQGCDTACNAADPQHGFSYAGCSAKCVARKAACDGEIVYDDTADWSKRQYDAAKPWVKEKARETKDLIDDAPNHTEYKYPSNDKN